MWSAINVQIAATIVIMIIACFMLSTGLFYRQASWRRRTWDIVSSLFVIVLTMTTLINYNVNDVARFLEKLVGK